MASIEPTLSLCAAHTRQIHEWDCGIACAHMLLKLQGVTLSYDEVLKACDTRSVWTIDLAVLLANYKQQPLFTTVVTGVNPAHASDAFYKADLSVDEKRVQALFDRAKDLNVTVEKRSVSWDELRSALSQRTMWVVCLVDARLLHCTDCSGWISRTLRSFQRSFQGHFILLRGITADGRVEYLDPATSHALCTISAEQLDKARLTDGTDQDLIFVRRVR